MEKTTRRKFIETCAILAVPGVASQLICGMTGCKRETRADAPPTNPDSNQMASPTTQTTNPSDAPFEAAYLKLHKSGELKQRGEELWKSMESCMLCHRECGADRLKGKVGTCRATSRLDIASYQPHFGEERPLVGRNGSGTIFFSHCTLRCVFCINWEINHEGQGSPRTIEDLATMMLHLQRRGCHNINVVTPTHYSPHILLALDIAASKGLRVPVVYNTCGWERIDILRKLDGVVDIYMPDFKYADGKMASKYSAKADTYPEDTKAALLEMNRQVGVAKPAADGLLYRGLLIRHLVMPNNVSGSKEVLTWIGQNLPKDTYINIMSQYRPMYQASSYAEIARRITRQEYAEAVQAARAAGLTNLDIQGSPF
jgi:putative pyruvate formate lyase activating enzyme